MGLPLFIPFRAFENRVPAAVAEAGFTDITFAQARVRQRIGDNGTRLTELAEAAQVTKQTAGYLVTSSRTPDTSNAYPTPTDGRARLIRLTDKATEVRPLADRVVAEIEDEWTAHLGPQRMAQLRETLGKLREITDPYR